jgi:hypothetical protein
VDELLAAYGERDLRGEVLEEDGLTSVRTPFSRSLLPVAERWIRGAVKSVPTGMTLDGARLRLWAIGAGRRDEHGYLLRLSPHDPPIWDGRRGGAGPSRGRPAPSSASARAAPPTGSPAGAARSGLGEYVGERPAAAGADDWPA